MKNSRPLVSVLLVVRNVQSDIKKCLRSIFEQSYDNLELVLIDDFSTDRTVDMCERIINNYRGRVKIQYFKNPKQQGLTKSLNEGIVHCQGKYIARQDGDDWSHKDRISKQVDYMESHDCDLLGSNYFLVDRFNIVKVPIVLNQNSYNMGDFLKNYRVGFPHGSFFIRSWVLKANRYNESCLFCQDFELLVWFALNKYKINCHDETLYYHKKPSDYNKKKRELKSKIHQDIIDFYKCNDARLLLQYGDSKNLGNFSNNFNLFNHYLELTKTLIKNKVYLYFKKK